MSFSVLYATTNPGKLAEVGAFLADVGVTMLSPADVGVTLDVAEDGLTLEANAQLKLEAWLPHAPGLAVMCDDTGLEIDALDGEPGPWVRRWADRVTELSDEQVIAHCMHRMAAVPEGRRGAQVRTVIALAFPDGRRAQVDGTLRGRILSAPGPQQIPGFPLEPLFYVDDWNMTLGEHHALAPAHKRDMLTHRTRAISSALTLLGKERGR